MTEEKKMMSQVNKIISVVLLIIGVVIVVASVAFFGVRPNERDIFLLGAIMIVWGAYKISGEKGKVDRK